MDELGVTYLPFAFSSDPGYADLPLALLGAPVDIGALIKNLGHGLLSRPRPWVPDFLGATVGPRRKLDYGGSR